MEWHEISNIFKLKSFTTFDMKTFVWLRFMAAILVLFFINCQPNFKGIKSIWTSHQNIFLLKCSVYFIIRIEMQQKNLMEVIAKNVGLPQPKFEYDGMQKVIQKSHIMQDFSTI